MGTVFWYEQVNSHVPPGDDWLSDHELACLARMRFPKRRSDWRLGRWTAKCGIASILGTGNDLAHLVRIEIRPALSGAPEAFVDGKPAGVVISLSHRGGWGACAMTRSPAALGCDLELVEPRSTAFMADYFVAEELALLAQTCKVDRLATLLWSAKESALKALTTGLRLDTRDVVVTSVADPMARSGDAETGVKSSVRTWEVLEVSCRSGQLLQGWWNCNEAMVRTVIGAEPRPELTILDGRAGTSMSCVDRHAAQLVTGPGVVGT